MIKLKLIKIEINNIIFLQYKNVQDKFEMLLCILV